MRRISLLAALGLGTAAILTILATSNVAIVAQAVPVAVPETTPAPTPADPFFDDNVLQEIRLDINTKDWQTLKQNFESNAYYPADFKWNGQTVRNVGIRSRGNASRSGVKPGLRVDFNRYTAGQEFLGLKSFVLRNNTTDFSSMHERVSMGLFRRLGEPAPRFAHARLYVNGAYAGLYGVVESLDKSFLKRVFGENDGTLFKFDRGPADPPYYLPYVGPNADLYVPHPFSPETNETDPQPQPLVEIIRTVAEASDANFKSAIAQYIDVPRFLKHIAITVYMGDDDGFLGDWGMNNFDWYRAPNQNQFVLIAWDKSEAMRFGPEYSIFRNINGVPAQNQNRLMARILAFPDLRNLYLDTMVAVDASAIQQITPTDTRTWMQFEVDREYDQIRDAALADPEKVYTNDDFEAAAADVKTFARRRSAFVQQEVFDSR